MKKSIKGLSTKRTSGKKGLDLTIKFKNLSKSSNSGTQELTSKGQPIFKYNNWEGDNDGKD